MKGWVGGVSIEGGAWGMARRKKQMCEQEGSQAAVEAQDRLVGTGLGGGAMIVRAVWDGQAERAMLNGQGGVKELEREDWGLGCGALISCVLHRSLGSG